MKPLRLNREQLLLVAALLALVLLVGDRLLLTPFLRSWSARATAIDALRASLAQGQVVLDQEARWQRWRDDMHPRLLAGNPAEAESALLTKVDGWAREAGLTVTALRPRWKELVKGEPLLELQLSGNGSLPAVARFLYNVESSPVALAVEQVAISASKPDGSALALDVRLSALTNSVARQATP